MQAIEEQKKTGIFRLGKKRVEPEKLEEHVPFSETPFNEKAEPIKQPIGTTQAYQTSISEAEVLINSIFFHINRSQLELDLAKNEFISLIQNSQ